MVALKTLETSSDCINFIFNSLSSALADTFFFTSMDETLSKGTIVFWRWETGVQSCFFKDLGSLN